MTITGTCFANAGAGFEVDGTAFCQALRSLPRLPVAPHLPLPRSRSVSFLSAVGACPIPVGDTTPTPWPGTNTNTGGGMSFWGVFFILLLIAVAVYLIGGVMYKRLVMGARGFEQMPNADTWRSVGAMCSGGSKRGASYDQI